MSGRKLKAISTRPSQPLVEGRVEIAPLTPNTVALSASQSSNFGILWRDERNRPSVSLASEGTGEFDSTARCRAILPVRDDGSLFDRDARTQRPVEPQRPTASLYLACFAIWAGSPSWGALQVCGYRARRSRHGARGSWSKSSAKPCGCPRSWRPAAGLLVELLSPPHLTSLPLRETITA